MAEFKTIPLDRISVPERLRLVEEDQALAIQASIVEHGLINPITVRQTPRADRPYTLVTGAHRLRAVELLDEPEIEAIIVKADADEAQLQEITENLIRNELSALDRAVFVISYRDVWERKYGKIERGGDQTAKLAVRSNLIDLVGQETAGFASYVAEKLGVSQRSVERAQFLGQKLHHLRRYLRGTPAADNQSLLMSLARMTPERRRAIAAAMDAGRSLDEAIGDTEPNAKAQQKLARPDRAYGRIADIWGRITAVEKWRALDHMKIADLLTADQKAVLAERFGGLPEDEVDPS